MPSSRGTGREGWAVRRASGWQVQAARETPTKSAASTRLKRRLLGAERVRRSYLCGSAAPWKRRTQQAPVTRPGTRTARVGSFRPGHQQAGPPTQGHLSQDGPTPTWTISRNPVGSSWRAVDELPEARVARRPGALSLPPPPHAERSTLAPQQVSLPRSSPRERRARHSPAAPLRWIAGRGTSSRRPLVSADDSLPRRTRRRAGVGATQPPIEARSGAPRLRGARPGA